MHNTDIFIKYLTKVSVEVFIFFHTMSFHLQVDIEKKAGSEPSGKSVSDLQKSHH